MARLWTASTSTVLAWREALEETGIELSVWRIHRRIGMSGGLLVNALLRDTGHQVTAEEAARVQRRHAEAYRRQVSQVRLARFLARVSFSGTCRRSECRGRSRRAAGSVTTGRDSRASQGITASHRVTATAVTRRR